MNGFIFLTMVLRADGTVTTNSGMHSKLYIVYLEIYVVPIGRGFSFFWSWKIKCWKRGGTLVTEDRFHGQQPIRLDKMIRFCPAMGEGGEFWIPVPMAIPLAIQQQIWHDNTSMRGEFLEADYAPTLWCGPLGLKNLLEFPMYSRTIRSIRGRLSVTR